jgi:iron complex transport system substrate-binding protein
MQKHKLSCTACLLLVALLTGCVAPLANPTGAEPTASAATTETSAAADSDAAASDCAEGFRWFEHELLVGDPICIPAAPQRVLPLDMAALEVLLLTGQTPVATGEWKLQELPLLLPDYAEQLATFEGVGYPAELEQVAALQPDLILTTDDAIDIKLAREIAPVVVADQAIYENWKNGMRFWSDVLNVPELYVAMEANYATRVAELKTTLGNPGAVEISVISASTYGISLWMPDSPPGSILNDVGLARPAAQSLVGDEAMARYGEKQYIQISEERLDLADGDAIFYFTYAATDPETAKSESDFIQAFDQKPIWQSLSAVKAGKAFFVPGYWWRAQTYLLANLVIDDLFTYLTDTMATTPVLAANQ